jgi:hypothetical protein
MPVYMMYKGWQHFERLEADPKPCIRSRIR